MNATQRQYIYGRYVQMTDASTPWTSDDHFRVYDSAGRLVCLDTHAPRIVRAVNAFAELVEALRECADDLEASVEAYYANTKQYASEQRRYERDIEPVIKARAALSKAEGPAS